MNTSTQKHRESVLGHPHYWVSKIQLELFRNLKQYLSSDKKNTSRKLAKKLNVTPGYISQVLNGNFDHKISKFVELLFAVGKVPIIRYENIDDVIRDESRAEAKPSITLQAPLLIGVIVNDASFTKTVETNLQFEAVTQQIYYEN